MALFVGLFLILFGTNLATSSLDQPVVASLSTILADLAWVALYAFFCLFPNGRFVPRWMWVPLATTILAQIPESLPPHSPYAVNNWPPL